ncbi:TetR/AcrR family transcriptional regulator [Gammaproteobacteria bacterium LSUCC0112]|nr:TetR/AcrR family transcriptional regulator [Gammaproteobacteria bacterium LSUCC0112]
MKTTVARVHPSHTVPAFADEPTAAAVQTLVSRLPDDHSAVIANQIVDEFAHKARVLGIRSISMAELASALRMSTKTLYKYFSNKDELVHELVVRWEARVHKPISAYGTNNLMDILRYRIKVWVENDAQYSTAFWLDLKTGYPALYKVYIDSLHESMRAMRERLGPFLRDDIDVEFAWVCYFTLMTDAARRKTFEKVGMTREQCVFAAFDFWVRSALDPDKLANAAWA